MFVENLVTFLKADAGLTTLVAGRIHPVSLKQDEPMPAVVYQQTSGAPDVTMDKRTGHNEATFQIRGVGATYKDASLVADAVAAALHGYSGAMGGIAIQGAFQIGRSDTDRDKDTLQYGVDVEFRVVFQL